MKAGSKAVKKVLLWLTVAAVIAAGVVLYHSRSQRQRLNVEPHAREEIEKAMRR